MIWQMSSSGRIAPASFIVPGNHDVQWNRAKQAMAPLEPCPPEIAESAFDPNSKLRWSWPDQLAYRVQDDARYESRLEQFSSLSSRILFRGRARPTGAGSRSRLR